ncbi:RAN GTPase-activating protein 2 isoform X2 [Brachypodium distachyon]|uniref:RAN GTPase-activating protein 2 isoform X2 n=1 Tax=Brachypodium distachyon TaxID=15368 RepID=UPI000D0D1E11|nr:RAN GTPase-activating protein 2 isoform X2 [Brachypodium distachyon]|eukprot:XP_014756304.2 RAN GTPase-activating protein 2 isoform X2 [Brachypodium distachyon]
MTRLSLIFILPAQPMFPHISPSQPKPNSFQIFFVQSPNRRRRRRSLLPGVHAGRPQLPPPPLSARTGFDLEVPHFLMDSPVWGFSIKLWPLSESTRLMVIDRMTENPSTETLFSRKYGRLDKEEARENAKRIEETCFASVDEHFKEEPDGDGSSAVQLYARETSKLMVEVLKRGPRASAELEAPVVIDAPLEPADTVLDISGGKRAFIDTDEAKELLIPLTKPGNSYKRICFSNRSFGIDAANVAGPILESIKKQITEVDISDFVAGRPEDEALDVMRIFSKALEGSVLRYLNISDNALGEKGVRAFEELLKSQDNLEEFSVMNDGISEEAAKALSELIPSTEILKVLHFHNNMTGDEGALSIAEMVKRSSNLESFRCSATRIGSDGGVALAEALGTCTRLKKLDLRDNLFGVEAGIALSKTLPKLPDLVELYLSDLNLENKGTIAIANALKQSAPRLEVLEMAGNEITAKATQALAECLTVMQSLKKLTLAENELEDRGAVVIAKTLENSHPDLKELDVSTNMLRRAGARCFAQAIADKPGFVQLNINGNFISDEGIEEVKKILKSGKNSLSVLGSLDENDPEGEPGDGDEEGDEEDDEGGLDSKLQNLNVEQD